MIRSWSDNRNSIMSTVAQIAEGFYNNLLKKKEDLYIKRINICRDCPLLKIDPIFGEVCNPSLYINAKGETSKTPKSGYIKGCGCVMASKTRVDEAHCVINKW